MARTDHGGESPFPALSILLYVTERTDATTFRKPQRCFRSLVRSQFARRGALFLSDTGRAERLTHPSRPISALRKRARLRQGVESVVDHSARGEALDKPVDVRRRVIFPPPLAEFAIEVSGKLGPRRREAPDIVERKLVESLSV